MVDRADAHATHTHGDLRLRHGRPIPFGASRVPGGVNFSVYSRYATGCTLVLFRRDAPEPFAEIPVPDRFRIGNVWSMIVFDVDADDLEYGYRMQGPWEPHRGHRFDPTTVLIDPYAPAISGRDRWCEVGDDEPRPPRRSRLVWDDYDWRGDRPLRLPQQDLVIYELHVRGFTRHPSSGTRHPGTFAGLRDKIDWLRDLGVNAVELMPIFEFDELEVRHLDPTTGRPLRNFWGYGTIGFFAPKAGYASTGALGMQADELKTLVRALHDAGIEVILDVVLNHTAEGGDGGPTLSFRGLDNRTWYMLTADGGYLDFSGTGNTLNCNHPVVRHMVIDCLRHWVSEYHIDGFRFDLAAILGRAPDGRPLENPPLIEALAHDPVLAHTRLIAEAWDAGGLYQVGRFPAYGRWAEWNGRYRDVVRRWLRGDTGQVRELALRVTGSPDLYPRRGPLASINFVTCHDGFTLSDLFAYDQKHNLANGEQNRDGANHNDSWNHGVEGPTDDPFIVELRERQARNAFALLMLSVGVPMLSMGDEMGRSQHGNNNVWCQDNPLGWVDWDDAERNADRVGFVQALTARRRHHPILRRQTHLSTTAGPDRPFAELTWHGVEPHAPDWSDGCRTLAWMLCGTLADAPDDLVWIASNTHDQSHRFRLPPLPPGRAWHVALDTTRVPWAWAPGAEPPLDADAIDVGPRSVVALVAVHR